MPTILPPGYGPPNVELRSAQRSRTFYEFVKRLFDLVGSVVGLVLLAPALIVIGILVKLTSRGPLLYRGLRTGRYGKPFRIIKFRTMVLDAERAGTTTTLRDPRVTRIGSLLRQAKLDELPQLLNVVFGEMSLVGPRPEVAEHTDVYTLEERAILDVKPGITDFASIQFVSLDEVLGDENPHEVYVAHVRAEKNALRLRYVRERSFWTDLCILGATIRVIVRKLLSRT